MLRAIGFLAVLGGVAFSETAVAFDPPTEAWEEIDDVADLDTLGSFRFTGGANQTYKVRFLKPNGQELEEPHNQTTNASGACSFLYSPAPWPVEGQYKVQLWPAGTTDFTTGDPLNWKNFEVKNPISE